MMAEFYGFGEPLVVESSNNPAFPDGVFVEASGWYSADLAPAIAAAVLEAAGVELTDQERRALDNYTPQPTEDHREDVRTALYCLTRAEKIREYHAKPRVTPGQVMAVKDSFGNPSAWDSGVVEAVLQAALDSGVLQVPADPPNKEGDR